MEASDEADRRKMTHSTGVSILAPGDPSIEGWVLTGSWPTVLESTARLLKSISQGSSPLPQPGPPLLQTLATTIPIALQPSGVMDPRVTQGPMILSLSLVPEQNFPEFETHLNQARN